MRMGWSIVYCNGSQVRILKTKNKKHRIFVMFGLANRSDTDEMPPFAAFDLGIITMPCSL